MTPFTLVEAGALPRLRLRPEQLVVVNCPGQLPRSALGRLRDFVAAGGSLFTTDWALRHVLEPAFPGMVAFNERPTRDDVVRIEIREHDNPFLHGVMDGADEPVWWLEGSSYPIRILERERVDTLIASAELEAKYGEAPVAVMFRHGQGEVFHMISHYYLQRTELRSQRHQQPAAAYATAKSVSRPRDVGGDGRPQGWRCRVGGDLLALSGERACGQEAADGGRPMSDQVRSVVSLLSGELRAGEIRSSGPLTLVALFPPVAVEDPARVFR